MFAGLPYTQSHAGSAWGTAFLQDDQLVRRLQQQIDFRLAGLADYDRLERMMRDVRLRGDPLAKIYEHATIRPRKCMISDLTPLSLYVLRPQIAQHKKMFWNLQSYNQNLFDLAGLMDYSQAGSTYTLTPPIVETYLEPTTGEWVTVIIDGLHRIYAALELGFDEVWVIEVSGVSPLLPPVALPVAWSELQLCSQVPPTESKRRYRYQSLEDYPDIRAATSATVTRENYLYYLYRDLSPLGSSGIRQLTTT